MKMKMDKLRMKLKNNNKIIIFLTSLLIIGIIVGTFFSLIISKDDKSVVSKYLLDFLSTIKEDKLSFLNTLVNGLTDNLSITLIIWLLGISIIGIPIILFLFFSKSFLIGFTIGSIIINYKVKGCLLALIYLFPHQIINLLLYTLLVIYSLTLSIKLIFVLIKRKSIDFKPIINKYFKILLICIVGFILTSLYESFIMPKLIKTIIPLLKV